MRRFEPQNLQVEMLEGPVAGALSVENFSEISEKAVLQDLQRLWKNCFKVIYNMITFINLTVYIASMKIDEHS